MMLNPLNLKHLNRMDENPADMITLNLEDAIAPSRKREALGKTSRFSYLIWSTVSSFPRETSEREEWMMRSNFTM